MQGSYLDLVALPGICERDQVVPRGLERFDGGQVQAFPFLFLRRRELSLALLLGRKIPRRVGRAAAKVINRTDDEDRLSLVPGAFTAVVDTFLAGRPLVIALLSHVNLKWSNEVPSTCGFPSANLYSS